jgi:hypothetical protein
MITVYFNNQVAARKEVFLFEGTDNISNGIPLTIEDLRNVSYIKAESNIVEEICSKVSDIPKIYPKTDKKICYWYGDDAKFILANLIIQTGGLKP